MKKGMKVGKERKKNEKRMKERKIVMFCELNVKSESAK